ncbi:MAG: hypothetical protein H6810_08670 [Phycisphaeraceae bacterium]|nr:MAG: hypothetical protein H6810_08670 [Phycisphaeraceae bacterium]
MNTRCLPGSVSLALLLAAAPAWAEPTADGEPTARELVARPPYQADYCKVAGCGKAAAAMLAELNGTAGDTGGLLRDPRGLEDTDVLHNDVELELSVSGYDLTINGSNTITVRSLIDGLTQFDIRLRTNYTITSATVNGNAATVQPVDTVTRTIVLGSTFNTGDEFDLRIEFNGLAVSRGLGSIEVDYAGGQPVVASLSEPYYAYTWWPCKDGEFGAPGDNDDKATLDLAIIAPSTMRSVANGVLEGVDSLSGNRSRYRWHSDYPLSTYLVMIASHPYNTWTQTFTYDDGQTVYTMPVEFNIYPADDTTNHRTNWNRVVDMLGVFSDQFGLYPFIDEKYGIYEFPFSGGMEHQTNTGEGVFIEYVNAHELTHQWFGDMITCRTWSDIWLNEGFATYGEAIWEEFKNGGDSHAALVGAMNARRPSASTTTSYSVYVYDTTNEYRIFDYDTSYLKGGWVVHMLRGVMGDETFFQFLGDYRAQFAYKAATTADLQLVAENSSGLDLDAFFSQWVYEPGQLIYRYGWQNATIDGQNYVRLRLRQTQSASLPTFVMPVEVALGAERATVENTARTQHFLIPVAGTVGSVSLDPDTWILLDGATTESYVAGPPKIVRTTPAPGDEPATLGDIEVVFSDPVTASIADFALNGPNGGVVMSFSQPETNRVVLTPASGAPGLYTLTVSDAIVGNGLALDGEIGPGDPFPSGDGLAGGDAVVTFAVAPQGCNPADLVAPYGVLDLADIGAFVSAFIAHDAIADLAEPFGVFDLADLAAFVNAFVGGCP